MNPKIYDILVIGGGINGTGIACDAAGRRLSVALCEQNDLASGTSSASTKLIHGGLRYLEQGEFRLVHEALNEREVLMAKAPHLISPLTLVLPHSKQLRPRWMLRLGLWLYDHLGRRVTLPKSRHVAFHHTLMGEPLKPSFTDGFTFSDCWVDDARLVVANAQAAQQHGADILTQTAVEQVHVVDNQWHVDVYDKTTEQRRTVCARVLVDATGPWLNQSEKRLTLSKGSHIIVRQTYPGTHAYLIQHTDNRVIFVIPYEKHFTLIGTTDVFYHGNLSHVEIDAAEQTYLLDAYNAYFKQALTADDVVSSYAGVRPLLDDGSDNLAQTTREYLLPLTLRDNAPLLSVLGGKLTTYRTLAEQAMEKLAPFFPHMGPVWTKQAPLPGGDLPGKSLEGYIGLLSTQFPYLTTAEITRLAHLYGSNVEKMLAGCVSKNDLGEYFGAGCYEKELRYAMEHEWVKKPEDFLYRRTKLYLPLSREEQKRIVDWFKINKV